MRQARNQREIGNKQSLAVYSACYLLHVGFSRGSFFNPEDGGKMVFPKRRLTFNGLRDVMSQKIELFLH
jgi:hypothetical protein